jgi:hypothetical protein
MLPRKACTKDERLTNEQHTRFGAQTRKNALKYANCACVIASLAERLREHHKHNMLRFTMEYIDRKRCFEMGHGQIMFPRNMEARPSPASAHAVRIVLPMHLACRRFAC